MPCTQAFLDANLAPDVDKAAQAKINVPITYAGNPTNNVTPEFQHQFCHDTSNGDLYWASTAAAAGWKKLNN
jgi:hypothetical protein